ncbi:MAG: ABC transporter permease [Acidimicrobiia bacterium]
MRNSPADVFLAQHDVRTMHMTQSALPPDTVEEATRVDGVAWAEGLRYTTSIVNTGTRSRLTYLFGYDVSTGRGGPRQLESGRAPGDGEVLVDEIAAGELGIHLGDIVTVLGQPFRVSGFSTDGTNIVNTTVYITNNDFADLRGDSVAYVLVGAKPGVRPDLLTQRLSVALPQTTAMTKAEFADQEASVVRDMAADIMKIITVVGFLIALAVVALTLFATTLSKLREYGVVKAIGAQPIRLVAVVLAQVVWTVVLGLVVSVALSLALGSIVEAVTPNVVVAIEPASVLRTGLGALGVGAFAAVIPLRRVLRVDPATAFRRAS